MRSWFIVAIIATLVAGCADSSSAPVASPRPASTPVAVASPRPTAAPMSTATLSPEAATATVPLISVVSDAREEQVSIGERDLLLSCAGSGTPTVVLDAGLGADHTAWSAVQPAVTQFTRVCSYDRAGLGQSDAAPTPRTGEQIVADLHALLVAAGEPGPYVLVGHSFGGLFVRLYAQRYPDEVAGMVLVDAVHEDWWPQALAALPPASADENQRVALFRRFLTVGIDDPTLNAEQIDLRATADEMQAVGSLGDTPLVVITAGIPDVIAPGLPPNVDQRLVQLLQQDFPADLAGRSTNSLQVVAPKSGHDIPRQQPEIIVVAINSIVRAQRGQ